MTTTIQNTALCAGLLLAIIAAHARADIQSTDYPSLQAAIDANPGRMIYVPNGDHLLTRTLTIETTGTSLCGPGRLVMLDPAQDIIYARNAAGITLRDLTLTRPPGKQESGHNGISAEDCAGMTIDGVSIIDNRGEGGGIRMAHCLQPTVRNCVVRNYKAPTIDDRTKSPEYGFAFKCVDGTGMKFFHCTAAQITNNRIIETVFVPSREMRDKYDLGRVTELVANPGPLAPPAVREQRYFRIWHQGSGLIFGGLGDGQYAVISGNYIESAAQGIDLHADNVTVTGNIVIGGLVGIKAMHGSRHVIISNNQFSRVDGYGILLSPGAASHDGIEATGDKPAEAPNIDGGTVVTGNVITDFGFGGEYWNCVPSPGQPPEDSICAISLRGEQLPDDPPLRDVIITNNVVYDTGRDKMLVDGKLQLMPPRYRYALWIEQDRRANPRNVQVHGNIFHPGSEGIANIPLAD